MPAPEETVRKGKKRSHPSSGKNSSNKTPKQRRKQFSDVSETATNSSSGEAEDEESAGDESEVAASNKSSDVHRNNPRKLTDQDLWRISACMASLNWRALGRTMGIEESVLLNLEQSFKGFGVRECAYQMLLEWKGHKPRKCTLGVLYTSLCNEKMISVAKQILQINFNDSTN